MFRSFQYLGFSTFMNCRVYNLSNVRFSKLRLFQYPGFIHLLKISPSLGIVEHPVFANIRDCHMSSKGFLFMSEVCPMSMSEVLLVLLCRAVMMLHLL